MTAASFATLVFAALILSTSLHLWLGLRQVRHVTAHRDAVPEEFIERIPLPDHQKAADYTLTKSRQGQIDTLIDAAMFLIFTIGGLLAFVDGSLRALTSSSYLHGLLLFGSIGVIGFVVGLPSSLYRTFGIEARFGFNKMTWQLWCADLIKGTLLSVVIGAPLLLAVLWLLEIMGSLWWFYTWLVWLGFNLLLLVLYPTVIAPLFNKFQPLEDGAMKTRIEGLLARCGFASSGLFVMDGSKRTAHGNAYFTGFGRAKRIVFFDTLLEKLAPQEVEAVLAHELGHFRRRHVVKRIIMMSVMSLALLWVLGQLIDQSWFYVGLGVGEAGKSPAMGLVLFSMVLPLFLFPLAPLTSALSRRQEYEADDYAAEQTSASDLITALVKLYRDNASTLTPDPLHSMFHDSHPPAHLRISHLQEAIHA